MGLGEVLAVAAIPSLSQLHERNSQDSLHFPSEHLVEFWEKNLQAGITSLCPQFPGMSHSHTSLNQVLASCEQLLAESFYTFI